MFPRARLQWQVWKLSLDRRRVWREWRAKYTKAQKDGKSQKELWALEEDRMRDETYVDDAIIEAETSYLIQMAHRLRVPQPDYFKEEIWKDSYTGKRCLTQAALADFRTAIRRELNERWQYWELRLKVLGVLLTGLTGAIGALIGLVATYRR